MDTSSTNSGVAVWESGELKEHFLLTRPKSENKDWMGLRLISVLEEYSPDIVIVEQEAVTRNMETVRTLTMIIGVIKGWCLAKGTFFDALKPSEWRKLISKDETIPLKREEAKLWAVKMAKELFGFDAADDECEAVLIGQAYINLCNL